MSSYEEVLHALEQPGAYPEQPPEIERLQTHVSHLFLTPKYVYKLKKPVNLGFLDFSTLEKRRHFSYQELALNRRISPDVYLDVAKVRRSPGGRIAIQESGEVLEHLVKMRRLPDDRSMASLLADNHLTEQMVRDLGRMVGEFHLRAERGPKIAKDGSREAVAYSIDENFRQTEAYVTRTITETAYDRVREYSERFLREQGGLLDLRTERGRVRDCHGDLHTAQVFYTDKGIRVIDCIEFSDRFRHIDIASDVAFMAMDLDHAGRYDLSRALVAAWLDVTHDHKAGAVMEFYKVYRAYVRGKVESIRSDAPGVPPEDQLDAGRRARSYFNLAHFYVRKKQRPALMLSMGLIGAGKSTMARYVGADAGFAVLSSDIWRKRLAGLTPDSRNYTGFEAGLYTPEFTHRTYKELLDQARPLLLEGHSVVLDATFGRRSQREAAAALAAETGADYWVAECVAGEREVRERLRRRQQRGTGVSDGRWEIYLREKGSFEPVDEVGPDRHLVVHTSSRSVMESVRSVLARLGEA